MEGARMVQGKDGIFDFEELVVEPRLVRVAGEVADVAIMPVGVVLAIAKMSDRTPAEVRAAAELDGEAEIRKVAHLISQVCISSNDKFTPEFLMENLTGAKFRAFSKFVMQPYIESVPDEEEAEPGNPDTDESP